MMSNFRILLGALVCAAFCCQAAAADVVHATLRAEAQVDGRQITLGDIAQLSGAQRDSLASWRQVALATAPQPGYSAHFTRREVEHLVREAGMGALALDGAEATTVFAVSTPFDPAAIVQAAKAALTGKLAPAYLSLELTPSQAPAPVRLPRGVVTLRARQIDSARVRSHMLAWVDILLDGNFYRAVAVSFDVKATQGVLVARAAMHKGQRPACADFEPVVRDTAPLMALPYSAACERLAHVLRRDLPAGEVLMSSELASIPVIREGELVTLRVNEGAVLLESRVQAMADGDVGQRIAVRAASSQESVLAMVVGPGVVNLSGL